MSTDPYVWIAAILTLGVFSFLYKDNVFFAVCEHLVVGLSAGYMFCIYWNNVFYPELILPLSQNGFGKDAHLWVPVGICFLWACKYTERTKDMYRLALAFWLSIDLGLSIPTHMDAGVLAQIAGTISAPLTGTPVEIFGNLVLILGTSAALFYFFFSREQHGFIKGVSTTGTWILMLGFGASFSYVILSRIYLLIGRLLFLFRDWLGIAG
ncbi:MAG: hypothetical protein JXX29_22355 [Deltaproteobacteria bacterium]|nr:hypothetical protein [Deltaproteobacteria bacterium]MBN2674439.1 hypothetical protein [Deltaproteobacteria bacterium]